MNSALILVLFFSSLIGYLVVMLLYFSKLKILLRQLEQYHSTQWATLNKPQLTANGLSEKSTIRLFLFLMRKEYLTLDDHHLNIAGSKTRLYLIVGLGLFSLLMLSAFLLPFA